MNRSPQRLQLREDAKLRWPVAVGQTVEVFNTTRAGPLVYACAGARGIGGCGGREPAKPNMCFGCTSDCGPASDGEDDVLRP